MVVTHDSYPIARAAMDYGASKDSIEVYHTVYDSFIVTASFDSFEIDAEEFDTLQEFIEYVEVNYDE